MKSAILVAFTVMTLAARHMAAPATDRIEVIGHVSLGGERAVNLLSAVHWRRTYLYVEHGSQGAVTVLDVTDPRSPKNTGAFEPPAGTAPLHMDAVEGSAAMFVSGQAKADRATSNVVIMSFADPAHPQVVREFPGVTCILKDASRHVTYLTNDEGLWVLHTTPAPDREAEEEYDRQLRYNH